MGTIEYSERDMIDLLDKARKVREALEERTFAIRTPGRTIVLPGVAAADISAWLQAATLELELARTAGLVSR